MYKNIVYKDLWILNFVESTMLLWNNDISLTINETELELCCQSFNQKYKLVQLPKSHEWKAHHVIHLHQTVNHQQHFVDPIILTYTRNPKLWDVYKIKKKVRYSNFGAFRHKFTAQGSCWVNTRRSDRTN